MTKEEFLQMVERVLDELREEKKKTSSKIEYYKEVNPNSKELEDLNYQLLVLERKIGHIKVMLGMPMYFRIKGMSSVEVAKYKEDLISDIKLKGVNITAEIQQLQEEIKRLKLKHEEIVTTFSELDEDKRHDAILQGQGVQQSINSKSLNLESLKQELESLKQEIEKIEKQSADEIKENLCSEVQDAYYLAQLYNSLINKTWLNEEQKFSAAVGSNPEKAQKLAKLMSDYTTIVYSQKRPTASMDIPYNIPHLLRKKIKTCFDYNHGDVMDTSRLYVIYEEFLALFNQELEKFNSQFNIEKLKGLVGQEYKSINISIDLEFLKKHSDKLEKGELEDLQSYILQRDKLSKKIIKTKEVKRQIEELNKIINTKAASIYRTIIGWYKSYDLSVINVEKLWNVDTLEIVQEHLKRCEQFIKKTQEGMTELKAELDKVKLSLSSQAEQQKNRREAVIKEMRELAGPEFENSRVPYGTADVGNNLNIIANSVAMDYVGNIASDVANEAIRQSELTDAQLNSSNEDSVGGKTL